MRYLFAYNLHKLGGKGLFVTDWHLRCMWRILGGGGAVAMPLWRDAKFFFAFTV